MPDYNRTKRGCASNGTSPLYFFEEVVHFGLYSKILQRKSHIAACVSQKFPNFAVSKHQNALLM